MVALSRTLAVGLGALAFAPAASAQLPNPCALLTNAQLVPALGGSPTHVASRDGGSRMCTWTGPPLGFLQERQTFMVSVSRDSKARFASHAYKDIPRPDPVPGLGTAAFSTYGGGFEIWQNGFELDLDGSYITVYPIAAKRLAQSALTRLAAAT